MQEIERINKSKIDRFFKQLSVLGYEQFEHLINIFDINVHTLSPFIMHSNEKYCRVCLANDGQSELVLMCWGDGQGTPIHSHGRQECWVFIVSGTLIETLYESNNAKIVNKREISEGTFTYLNDDIGFHRLHNFSGDEALSLHLYANPIIKCQVFDPEQKSFISVDLKYDKSV